MKHVTSKYPDVALNIALAVDRLFSRNRDYFRSNVEAFKQQEAGRSPYGREKDDEQSRLIEPWRPGPDPTPATMVMLLAALHDECLPDSPTILDLASYNPLGTARDSGMLALFGARVWCGEARAEQQHGERDRLDALETYLSYVEAAIALDRDGSDAGQADKSKIITSASFWKRNKDKIIVEVIFGTVFAAAIAVFAHMLGWL